MIDDVTRSGAPGALEDIRTLVNSWNIPNDTRVERDELGDWIDDRPGWATRFRVLPAPRPEERGRLSSVRDAIRTALSGDFTELEEIVSSQPPGITVDTSGVTFVARQEQSASDAAIALVLTAAADRTLPRLRTCGDCGWAFYDSSRNNRRRWCAMDPAPGGRGCGAAAKSRSYRARQQHA